MSVRLDGPAIALQAEMLENRLKKRMKALRKSMEARGTTAFQLYDRDIPEIRARVEWYDGHAVLWEYERTQTEGTDWREQMALATARALGVPREQVHDKGRRTNPALGARYQRIARKDELHVVREEGLRFLVNLDDYVDTFLFLDHRALRRRVGAESAGKRMLNLFAYTGAFSVHAARGGATSTLSVDTNPVYLDICRRNLACNGLLREADGGLQSEVSLFLEQAAPASWNLIVLDPPSFSDRGDLDIQRDHRALVRASLRLLAPGGTLYFSTNHQRFEPDLDGLGGTEITSETFDEDIRNREAHRVWSFRRV